MSEGRLFSKFFSLLAVLFLAGALFLVAFGLGEVPVVLQVPEQADGRTTALMEAIVQADLEKAGDQMYGDPSFRLVDDHTNAMNSFLWDYYLTNIDYSFSGGCYGVKDGLARDVMLHIPDVSAILSDFGKVYNQLLEERASELADAEEALFQRMILEEALNHILSEQPPLVSRHITLKLIFQADAWYVLPDDELLDLLSGIQ